MPLHTKASFEYAGDVDRATHQGPDLRPIPAPVLPLPAQLKSKRPAAQPSSSTALGNARSFRRLEGA